MGPCSTLSVVLTPLFLVDVCGASAAVIKQKHRQVWDLAQGACVQTVARAHNNAITSIMMWSEVRTPCGS